MSRLELSRQLRFVLATTAIFSCLFAQAQQTDLSNLPLSSSANLQVKPNVMFILDDSATMGRDYMPDDVGAKKDTVGFRNSSCNLVYYNPATDYVIPRSSLGGPINPSVASADWGGVPSTYTAALDDGFYYFDAGTLTQVDLRSAFRSHYSDSPQVAYYWTYLGGASVAPLSTDCNTPLLSVSDTTTVEICSDRTTKVVAAGPNCAAQGKTALWRKVFLSAATADQQENFANWFSYYRTRLNMMKSASGRAIAPLSESYRVGFLTIDPGIPVLASKFLSVADFNPTNKAAWFKKLYSQKVNDKTPLRTALSRAGRYYAGKVNDGINQGIMDDPVQFSCQQNFTILTTDGYWNTTGGYDIVGNPLTTNQDGNLTELDAYNATGSKFLVSPRPIYDGSIRFNWKTAAIEYRDNTACTYPQPQQRIVQYQTRTEQKQKKTVQNQTQTTQLQTRTTQLQKLTIQNQQRTVQNQRRTIQNQQKTTQLQTRTNQLETQITQLQKLTIQNQKRTVQNQGKTTQLQKRTTQLQKTSTQTQKKTTQLQIRTIQNQVRTVQNQSKTAQLQKRILQLQKKTARFRACSGTGGSGSCVDVNFDCTSGTGDGSKPYCYITNDSGWSNVSAATCPSASTETSTTVCQTVVSSGWTNVGTCTAASINSSGQTIECQTTNPSWVNVGTCTAAGINGSGQTVTCQVASDSGWSNIGTCVASNPASGPTVSCQQVSDSGWVNAGTCSTSNPASGPTVTCQTVTAQDWTNGACTAAAINGSGVTVLCQTPGATTVNTGSCAVAGINATGETVTACTTTNPSWTNTGTCTAVPINGSGQTVQCQTTNPAWVNVGTCTAAGINGSGQTVTCQISSDSGWGNIGTCVASNPASGPTVTCQEASNSGWVNAGTCTASNPASGPTVTCQTTNPAWTGTGACTPATINGSGQTVNCRTTNGTWTNVATCTPVPINGSGQTVECQTTNPAWVNAGTCIAAPINASGQTVTCQVASDTNWVNVGTCAASNPASGPTVTCQETSNTGWVSAGTCTASNPATGPTVSCQTTNPGWNNAGTCVDTPINTTTGQDVQCQTLTPAWTNVGTCTTAAINGTGATVLCQESSNSGWVNAGTCVASNPAAGPTITCQTISDTGFVDSGTCTASNPINGPTVTCQTTSDSGWANVSDCTPNPTASPSIACQTVYPNGHQLQYQTQITDKIYRGSNQTDTLYSTTLEPKSGWIDGGVCSATVPTLPSNGPAPAAGPPALPTGCTVWPCELQVGGNGSNTSLADVAQFYYKTDLRTAALGNCGTSPSVCDNDVKAKGTGPEDDKATWQHMTTFTLGLGVSGSLTYDKDYKTATTGDFVGLRDGTKDWPVPVINGADPDGELVNPSYAIDDLWHAAVDGRGQYFGADTPANVVSGLGRALNDIEARSASGSGAAVSNQQLLATGNLAFVTTYLTKKWTGNIQALAINAQTGALEGTAVWDAQAKLDLATKDACDNRTIKLFRQGATNNLVDFAQNTFACNSSGVPTGSAVSTLNATELTYFDSTEVANLSQYPSMTSSQRTAAEGAKMVNYLRGQRGSEGFVIGDDAKLFRAREHVLGDIVYAGPRYVQAPFAGYDDKGYEAYKVAQSGRTPMIYVAANDGMLHAFNAEDTTSGGVETWAFVPSTSLPNLHKIASENYGNEHVFSVDGTPTSNDVCVSDCTTTAAVWKTILVGGLRAGGKGYYAIDITAPGTPKALWEFKASNTCFDAASATAQYTDCHIGYTYGAPIIAKLHDGRWVVFVTSGYNNVNVPTKSGDGQGYLYVLEAMTGKIIYKISTGVGSDTTPSGLSNINARSAETLRDNTADFVYGTDLFGNIWRFDINDLTHPPGVKAGLVAQVVDSSGVPQAITTAPQLGVVNGQPYVYVATGRYLGSSDLLPPVSTQTQSIWAIKDPVMDTAAGVEVPTVANLRATLKTITTTTVGLETDTTAYRTNSCTAQCTSTAGWFTDLPVAGERVNVEMKLDLGTLLVASNVPPASACEVAGTSWVNFFDASSGLRVANSTNQSTGSRVLDASGHLTQVVGLQIIRTTTGQVVVQASTGEGGVSNPYVAFSTPLPTGKRVSWREIVQ